MMKRLYILLILLTAAFWGSGQTYLPDNTFGKTFNRILPFYALGIPNDTIAPPVAYQHYPHLAGKDSILYMWSPSLKRFLATGSRGTGTGSTYTFLAPLSNDGGVVSLTSVPWSLLTGKPTTLSGYGITDALNVSDTAAMLSGYMRKGVAGSAGHTHIGADITDGTTWVRNMFFGGTGVVYNNATGVIAIDSALVRSWLGEGAVYTFTGPLSESGGTVSITQANGSTNGYLSAVDWTLFNGKVSQDALDDTAAALRALIAASTPDSFTYATRRYVDSSVSALSGDFIINSTTQQTANFNITGNGVMGGNLDVTGSGNFAQNRVQLSHATLGGATKWYNTSGDLYSEVNPDQGGYMSSRRFVFNSAVGDPTAGTDYKGYLYMKSGVPYWSYNGTHTAIPLGGGGASTTSDLTDVSDAAPANNTVLTYNQDSGKYVPTQVAAFNFTDLQDGQYLSYDSLNNEWVNVDAPTGSGSQRYDTITRRNGIPDPTEGNMFFNTADNKLYITNATKTKWLIFAPTDSVNVAGTSTGDLPMTFTAGNVSGGTLSESPTGTWTPSASGLYAVATQYLPASTDGEIIVDLSSTTQQVVAMGLDLSATPNNYNAAGCNWDYEFHHDGTQLVYGKKSDGTFTNTGINPTIGANTKLKIKRAGTTITAEYTTNASTWTVFSSYTATTSAALYFKVAFPVGGKNLLNPIGTNVQ